MLKPAESAVKILLADDSVTMHRAVALSLKKLPWQLLTCDNGQDAWRLAQEQRPDIVIADLDMPGMTGAELVRAIRRDPQLARTRTILLCGSFEQVDESKLEGIPADGRLWKPFESHVLTKLIEALLKGAPTRESADPTQGGGASRGEATVPPRRVDLQTLQESGERTLPPTSRSGDYAHRMVEETFGGAADATVPPVPGAAPTSAVDARNSSLRERSLPVADVTPERAYENLWSPDLSSDETLPPVSPAPASARASARQAPGSDPTIPPAAPASVEAPARQAAGATPPLPSEFSSFRHSTTVEPTEILPTRRAQDRHERFHDSDTNPGLVPPAAAPVDDERVRSIVREEIDRALRGWFREELEKALADVLSEIDRA